MSKIYYSRDHEWVSVENGIATVGVTDHAQEQLGDVVFIELPQTGITVRKGQEIGVVESVKVASDVYAPVSGEVAEINGDLESEPGLVNSDAEGKAWFFKIKMSNSNELDDLMNKADYQAFAASSES